MRKITMIAALAAATLAMMAGTASAQYGGNVEVRNTISEELCDAVWAPCEQTLTGTMTWRFREIATQQFSSLEFTCDIEATTEFESNGYVTIESWEASPGNYEYCGESVGSGRFAEPCGGDPMTGWAIEPGTQWSAGDGFSILIDGNACFPSPFGDLDDGTMIYRLDDEDPNEVAEALSWTLDEYVIGVDSAGTHEVVISAQLEADTALYIWGPLN